jgi:predicted RNA-binding Zn-ribbon protein involved in translation (DUF1610 family)
MNDRIDVKNISWDYWEYSVNFTCPYCKRTISFNDQRQPYECECGHKFGVCLDIIEYT